MDQYRLTQIGGSPNRYLVDGQVEGHENVSVEGYLQAKVPKNVKGGHACEVVFVTDIPEAEPLTRDQQERGVDAVPHEENGEE